MVPSPRHVPCRVVTAGAAVCAVMALFPPMHDAALMGPAPVVAPLWAPQCVNANVRGKRW